jgi:hypothetical protein
MDDFDFLEALEGVGTRSMNNSNNQEISRMERLFTGDDTTSVGTLFTHDNQLWNDSNQNENRKEGEANFMTNNISHDHQQSIGHPIVNTAKSVSTSITIDELDQNMTRLSSEASEIKSMLRNIFQPQQETKNHNNDITAITNKTTITEVGVSEAQSTRIGK